MQFIVRSLLFFLHKVSRYYSTLYTVSITTNCGWFC